MSLEIHRRSSCQCPRHSVVTARCLITIHASAFDVPFNTRSVVCTAARLCPECLSTLCLSTRRGPGTGTLPGTFHVQVHPAREVTRH
eukprot:1110602-Rhodomonas_salina.1